MMRHWAKQMTLTSALVLGSFFAFSDSGMPDFSTLSDVDLLFHQRNTGGGPQDGETARQESARFAELALAISFGKAKKNNSSKKKNGYANQDVSY